MEILNLTVVGNSVALRTRPPKPFPNNKNYSIILEELLNKEYTNKKFLISNKSKAATIANFIKELDYIIRSNPHFYIINIGVVDSSTREISLWFYRLATQQKLQ